MFFNKAITVEYNTIDEYYSKCSWNRNCQFIQYTLKLINCCNPSAAAISGDFKQLYSLSDHK